MSVSMRLFIFLCSLVTVKREKNSQFLLAFVKTLTNSENCSQICNRISVPAFLLSCCMGDFASVLHVQFSESKAASGAVLRVIGSFLYGETST